MSVTPIPTAMKAAVTSRDGTKCLRCGVQTTAEHWTDRGMVFDHIKSEYHGGLTTVDNLQVLCRKCNLWKRTRYIDYRVSRVPLERRVLDLLMYTAPGHRVTMTETASGWSVDCSCPAGVNYFDTSHLVALGAMHRHLDYADDVVGTKRVPFGQGVVLKLQIETWQQRQAEIIGTHRQMKLDWDATHPPSRRYRRLRAKMIKLDGNPAPAAQAKRQRLQSQLLAS